MKLTKKSTYALIIISSLLDGKSSGKTIAENYNLSEPFVTLVLRELKLAGILSSKKGPGGGYVLNISVDKLTLGEVLDAVGENFKNLQNESLVGFPQEVLTALEVTITNFLARSIKSFLPQGQDDLFTL